ncbi:MAG TPA: hypothetical protein VGB37_16355, partial [Candidatus Lokiarchaeia archaeon]
KSVVIKAEAYKTIILYANRYSNNTIRSENWKEIYGILIGNTDDNFVYVERAEALTYGHSTNVQLDTKHYVFIDEIEQKLQEENKGFYMIGWFHSHPGLNLFFSYIDLMNQLSFQQSNPDFIGLVFDHTLLGKKKEEKIGDNILTKYDTGFEIYRISDVNLDVNNPKYDTNYHKVDYIVDGLNKFFFANLLTELSALAAAGKPLQSAYGEEFGIESKYKEPYEMLEKKKAEQSQKESNLISEDLLEEIPVSEDIIFDVDNFFYEDLNKKTKNLSKLKEVAEQSVFEGNQAFKRKDTFMGVEKYRDGIEKYKKLKENDKVLELLRKLSEHCISTEHFVLAKEFVEELFTLAENYNNSFYRAESNYLRGYILLKEGNENCLEDALKKIQEASIDYEKAEDFAGAGKCYHKIGTIYHSRLNQPFNACLFYIEAIKNHNEAILRSHPLRKSIWSNSESLSQRINEIKDTVEELIPSIDHPNEKNKIKKDLDSIQLNF